MAELILAQAETDALSWLDLDDDALGKAVRARMIDITDAAREHDRLLSYAAALLLIKEASDLNADKFDLGLNGVSNGDQRIGDWTVRVRRKPSKRATPPTAAAATGDGSGEGEGGK